MQPTNSAPAEATEDKGVPYGIRLTRHQRRARNSRPAKRRARELAQAKAKVIEAQALVAKLISELKPAE